ncbi:MAG TPA: NlpC/P60 family protein [Mycobacteriales bacterium]|nr:NlpC/P60 family protein [Mycobacteriales bacterium]
MAGFEHVRRLLRPGVVLAATVCVISSFPGVGSAAPRTTGGTAPPSVAEVQREVATLGRQLDAVSQQYDRAVIRLTAARRTRSAADATERRIDAQLDRDAAKVRVVASSSYRAGPLSGVASMVSSGSPTEFLDRLSLLDTLSRRQHRVVDGLHVARARAADAARAAHRTAAEAQRVAADLDAKKAWITRRLPRQRALLARLTADQRQQALDPAGGSGGGSAGTAPVAAAPASGRAGVAVAAAMSKLGSPYVWAAAGPDTFDCSGLVLWAWAQAGVTLPHYTGDQYNMGTHVSRSQLQPGDLVFFYPDISHVGMYIGGGNVIHAPQPGDVVKISPVDSFPYAGATRVG